MDRRFAGVSLPVEAAWPWLVAVLFFGVGDVVTTSVGLGVDGVSETCPVTRPLVGWYGPPAFVALKVAAFAGWYALWRALPRPYCAAVPVGLAVLGVALTAWNLHVLLSVLFA